MDRWAYFIAEYTLNDYFFLFFKIPVMTLRMIPLEEERGSVKANGSMRRKREE